MNKLLIAIASIFGFLTLTQAQEPTEKTLLWQVSGKGINKPSFLYGTLHLMCPDDLKMPNIVKEKFALTKQLFLEIDMDEPGMMQEMMQSMTMTDTSTLQSLFGEKYDSVSASFQKMTNLPLSMMSKAKPMMLMSMVYPFFMGCQPESWENAFMQMAKETKFEIKGLEKLSDQIKVFEKIPYKIQAGMLQEMLLNLDSSRKEMEEMQNLYKEKNIQAMQAMTTEKDFAEYEAILVNDRNNNWIPVIAGQAKQMPTFFAFGAGHLGGKNGVIQLLRNAGYKVTSVFYE